MLNPTIDVAPNRSFFIINPLQEILADCLCDMSAGTSSTGVSGPDHSTFNSRSVALLVPASSR